MLQFVTDSRIELYEDFIVAYSNVLKSLGKNACLVKKTELIRLAINSKAPRYYISENTARKIISKYQKTGEINSFKSQNRRMIEEIIVKYTEEIKKNPNKSTSAILEDIIYSEASSFFIARTTAYDILHRYYAKKK